MVGLQDTMTPCALFCVSIISVVKPVLTSLNSNLTESQMIQNLLDPSRYDKMERPNKYTGKPVDVEISVFVNSVSDVSDISMQLSMDLFLRLLWTEPRLSYESNPDFEGKIMLHESVRHQIWTPDVYIRNELKTGDLHTLMTPNVMLTVEPTGYIFYSQRISTKLFCMMHLNAFPMDSQKCVMEFEPYSHSNADMVFHWRDMAGAPPIDLRENLTLPEFNLTAIEYGDCTTYYKVGNLSGSWNCVYFTISLKRLFEYYLIQVYVPSMMVVILSWLSFWIDMDAVPARISLGLLTVLTITTQASGISSQLPKVSYLKAIDVWMFTCSVFVFGALIEYSAVNVLSRRDKEKAKLAQNENKKHDISVQATVLDESLEDDVKDQMACCSKLRHNNALKVETTSRILFPMTFVGFNICYWYYYYAEAFKIDG